MGTRFRGLTTRRKGRSSPGEGEGGGFPVGGGGLPREAAGLSSGGGGRQGGGKSLLGKKTTLFEAYFLRREELYRALLARCILLAGLMMTASGIVGSTDEKKAAYLALAIGGGMCVAGLVGTLLHKLPTVASRRDVFVAAGMSWLAIIGFSVLFYRLTGAFDNFDDALFESVAGFSTTSFSVFPDPSQLSSTVLFWRAGTQWLGGAGALSLSLLLIPLLYSKAEDDASTDEVFFANFWRRTSEFFSFFWLYVLLTLAVAVAYWAADMGAFDALTYSFTTVSTGGFANHGNSLAHFNSQSIEWVAIVAMFLAGINGALLFKALRGSVGSLWQSVEFRVYLGVVAVAAAACLIWSDVADFGTRLREVLFAVTSAVSTTGFRVVDWGVWNTGLQMLLLLLIATGAMVGSTSGGFQILRATEAAHYLSREILNYARPSAKAATRRHDFLGEGPLSRMQAFQMIYLATAAAGAFGLACFGNDVVTSLSGSISSLATMGPALGDLGPLSQASTLSRPERGLLAVLMLTGRLFIYPVLIIFGTLFIKARWLRKR